MRILNAYITRNFIITFLVALAVFIFVLAIGNIFKVIDLFSRGISGVFILKVFSFGIPYSLIFAIPMSLLAASFLVFSRMAVDNEMVAMKACGVSIWSIIQPPILIAGLLCVLCVYINCSLAPYSHFARRTLLGKISLQSPLCLLDEGRFVRDFPGFTIYIGQKEGNKVSDVIIYQFGERGLKQTIRAKSGIVKIETHPRNTMLVNLFNVRIDQADEENPEDLNLTKHLTAEEYPMEMDIAEIMQRRIVWKKRSDFTMTELFRGISGVPIFLPGELIGLNSLVKKLQNPSSPLSVFIKTQLSERTFKMLEAYQGSDNQRNALVSALIPEFNKLIVSTSLYGQERFKDIQLSKRNKDLILQKPEGVSLMRLNRFLLEDAYPHEIAKNLLSTLSYKDKIIYRTSLMVEASTRLALSFCCFAFVLLGIALGIKIHRSESTIGILVTLILVFVFYFFIIIADSLVSRPEYYPQFIVWIPFFVSEGIGFYLIRQSA